MSERQNGQRAGHAMNILEHNPDLADLVRNDAPAEALESFPLPLPLQPEKSKAAPYPIDQLPPSMRAAAEAIAYQVQAPIELAAQCTIGVIVYLAQSRINAPHIHRPDGMPVSMFQLTVADSGDRKSECRRLAFKAVDAAEKEARQDHLRECEQIASFAKGLKGKRRIDYLDEHPPLLDPRTQFSDATFEPIAGAFIRGMSAASWDTDEGGQVLAGASLKADTRAATLGGLVKVFDNGSIERTRASGNMEGSGFAFNRRLSIHLLAQPATVAAALNDPLLQGQGFLARFLFAYPESLAGTRLLSAERMQERVYLEPFWKRCEEIQATPPHVDSETGEVKPPVMPMSSEAEFVWMNFYNEIEREQAPLGEYAEIKPFAGRAGELVRRLAAAMAYFEGKDEIATSIMESACSIVRHSLNEWLRYMSSARPDFELEQAAALMDWLRDKGWTEFDKDTLRNQGPTRSKAKLRDKLLAILTKHRHLLTNDGKQFRINPLCIAQSAQSAQPHAALGAQFAQPLRTAAQTDTCPENLRTSAQTTRSGDGSSGKALRTLRTLRTAGMTDPISKKSGNEFSA